MQNLGDFIRAHRERTTPDRVGLPAGGRRRTPGLRREELAQLCDVSPTWLTWLEQGRDVAPSGKLLARLADVLHLSTAERAYLFSLAERLDPHGDEMHEEVQPLQAMVDAGMTPAQALVAATSRAAEYLDLGDRGSLVPGKRADFLLLDASPLDDIANTRRISRLFIGGVEIDRAPLRARGSSV